MPRIKNTTRYPIKEIPILNDFVIGSDSQDDGRTRNFRVSSVIDLFDGSPIQYKYSNILNAVETEGYLNTNAATFANVTTITINKVDFRNQNLDVLFDILSVNTDNVVLRIADPSVNTVFLYFAISSFTENTDSYVFNIQIIGTLRSGTFVEEQIYTVTFFVATYTIFTEYDTNLITIRPGTETGILFFSVNKYWERIIGGRAFVDIDFTLETNGMADIVNIVGLQNCVRNTVPVTAMPIFMVGTFSGSASVDGIVLNIDSAVFGSASIFVSFNYEIDPLCIT